MQTPQQEPTDVECSWDGCPSHQTFTPARAITVHWPRAIQKVRYFHSTECLSSWAQSFPSGLLITGEDSVNV
jgi:hypothetical protein